MHDSPLEEDGFEPSVPLTGYPVFFAKDPLINFAPAPAARVLPESGSLQRFCRRVRRRLDDQLRYGRTPKPQGVLGPDPLQFRLVGVFAS